MLRFQNGPVPGATVDLQPGVTRLGRHPDNDVAIDDPSVSSHHCELIFEAGELIVQDLGSTNGTFVDGQPVREAPVRPGQRLTLGNVELLYLPVVSNPTTIPPPPPPSLPPGTNPCRYHPDYPAEWLCNRCHHLLCASCAAPRIIGGRTVPSCPKCRGSCLPLGLTRSDAPVSDAPSFFQMLPGIFTYPFKTNGPAILLGGSLFFSLLEAAQVAVWLISLFLGILVWGYLFAYLDNVITTTAGGSDAPPSWPDFSDWWSDMVAPLLRWMAVILICLGPAYFLLRQLSLWGLADSPWAEGQVLLGLGLGLAGLVYLPMALLAAAMTDSVVAINPLVVLPSILKLPLQYATACLLLFAAVSLELLAERFLHRFPIPLLSGVVTWSLFLYAAMVEMRLLGLLYRTNQHRLGWFRR